jgi:hypothetical protein
VVRREASPHSCLAGDASELRVRGGGSPRPSARGAVDDAEQRSDRELDARLEPGRELLPGPVVHGDLAAAAALAAPYQQRTATRVQVGLGERERLADAQTGAPEHHDRPRRRRPWTPSLALRMTGHDLLDRPVSACASNEAPRVRRGGMSAHLTLPDEALEQLAAALLPLVVERLEAKAPADVGGWLNPARAAEHLSVPRRRISDLKSAGALEPDGYDGRTPLWRRATLDAYVRSHRT